MGTRWSEIERKKGQEHVVSLDVHWAADRNGGVGLRSIDTQQLSTEPRSGEDSVRF